MSTQPIHQCLIIGDPVAHSLSPALHRAGYRELGIDDRFNYETRRVKPEELEAFMREVPASMIRGISCTAPHKVAIMRYLDNMDPTAAKIGAVNTVVNDDGVLTGYNTDWLGVVEPLERLTSLKGLKVALLGAGGAAKAIAYGLNVRGAKLTVYNRTRTKAEALAREFGGVVASLEDPAALEAIKAMDVIINATVVGMQPKDDETPLARQFLGSRHIVFDSVYAPYETRLLSEAAEQGARTVHGTEMLLSQAMAQFKLYTGYDAPEPAMRSALQVALDKSGKIDD